MTPYYQQDGITIYHCDWRDYEVTDGVSSVIADPPYGIGWVPRVNHIDGPWRDEERPDIRSLLAIGSRHCFWGGNYFTDQLPVSEAWLLWIKRPKGYDFDGDKRTYSVCEMAWTDFAGKIRMKNHAWDGGKRAGEKSNRDFSHPAQKPVEIMRWCIGYDDTDGAVLDPFMGSGTTLVAAKSMGRSAIGVEIEERYCEIAAKRLAQGSFDFTVSGAAE